MFDSRYRYSGCINKYNYASTSLRIHSVHLFCFHFYALLLSLYGHDAFIKKYTHTHRIWPLFETWQLYQKVKKYSLFFVFHFCNSYVSIWLFLGPEFESGTRIQNDREDKQPKKIEIENAKNTYKLCNR